MLIKNVNMIVERVREVIQDGFDFVLHPPPSSCLQTVLFQSYFGAGPAAEKVEAENHWPMPARLPIE